MRKMMTAMILFGVLGAMPVQAQNISIALTNLTGGSYFTPLLIAAHTPGDHFFQAGSQASANLQAMAEGGDISGLVADMQTLGADIVQNPAGGLLAPGVTAMASLTTAAGNSALSLVAMILPTNDGFVGLDSMSLPLLAGVYTYYLNAYDAGTEANNELVNGGGAPGVLGIPADPGGNNGSGATGVTTTETNNTVHIHGGVLGDTDAAGGLSDLDSRIHRWLNPVAKLVITIN